MQKVALRRKKEPKQRHPNSRQLPLFITNDVRSESTAQPGVVQNRNEAESSKEHGSLPVRGSNSDTVEVHYFHSQANRTPLQGITTTYPSMLIKCQLGFLDLSLLASLEVGRYTGRKLLEHPQNLSHFLGGKNWSYCHYVPFQYQNSFLIRCATDSVIARVRFLLTPEDTQWESLALSSYSKALLNLQEALNATLTYPPAEVLCATQILGLYELLNPNQGNGWIRHAAGATCMIKLRGPDSYSSDFEKSLLMSHLGPILSESILNNQACFLDDPTWLRVILSIVTNNPDVPERSTMVISLLAILITIPRLFKDFTEAICHDPDPRFKTLVGLMTRAKGVRSSLQEWYSQNIGDDGTPADGPIFCNGYFKIIVLFFICSIYSNRLNTCIYLPETSDVLEIEEETQLCASGIVRLYQEEAHTNLQSSMLLAQKLPLADATIKSGSEWRKQLILGKRQDKLFKMPKETFEKWCGLFGRSTL